MKHVAKKTAYPDTRHACLLAIPTAVVIALLRTVLTPLATAYPLPYGIVLGVAALLLVGLFVFCRIRQTEPVAVGGRAAAVAAIGAAVTGATFLVFAVVSAVNWVAFNVMPYPNKAAPANIDKMFCLFMIGTAALSGLFFFTLAIRWLRAGYTGRYQLLVPALVPVIWSWFRLIRYITSYASLVGLFRDLYELSTILFEMVFFFLFARYLAGDEENRSPFFVGVSLCTGFLCTVSCLTQAALFVVQNETAFDTCALVVAPDFGVALLAFAVAFAQCFGKPQAEEVPEQPEEIDTTSLEDGEGAEFLIGDDWFTVYDPDENEEEVDEQAE